MWPQSPQQMIYPLLLPVPNSTEMHRQVVLHVVTWVLRNLLYAPTADRLDLLLMQKERFVQHIAAGAVGAYKILMMTSILALSYNIVHLLLIKRPLPSPQRL
ncbi:TPA: hypothetical protein ACH3X2_002641 [Trebouxia sp. C0005]